MKIPNSVEVFGIKYKVKIGTYEFLGQCDREKKIIHLHKEQSDREMLATLIHEIGHAVFSRISLVQCIGKDVEEVIVDALSVAVVENFDIKPRKK